MAAHGSKAFEVGRLVDQQSQGGVDGQLVDRTLNRALKKIASFSSDMAISSHIALSSLTTFKANQKRIAFYLVKRTLAALKSAEASLAQGVATTQRNGRPCRKVEAIFAHRTAQILGPLGRLNRHRDNQFFELFLLKAKATALTMVGLHSSSAAAAAV